MSESLRDQLPHGSNRNKIEALADMMEEVVAAIGAANSTAGTPVKIPVSINRSGQFEAPTAYLNANGLEHAISGQGQLMGGSLLNLAALSPAFVSSADPIEGSFTFKLYIAVHLQVSINGFTDDPNGLDGYKFALGNTDLDDIGVIGYLPPMHQSVKSNTQHRALYDIHGYTALDLVRVKNANDAIARQALHSQIAIADFDYPDATFIAQGYIEVIGDFQSFLLDTNFYNYTN